MRHGRCSEEVSIVLVAILDAISTLITFGLFSVFFMFKFITSKNVFEDERNEGLVWATYALVIIFLILYVSLSVALIIAAIRRNELRCWVWIVGTAGISLALVVGSLSLIHLMPAILMSLWILCFKGFSIFVVLKFVKNIDKNSDDVHSSIIEAQSPPVYVIPQQQLIDAESQNNAKENIDKMDDALPPSYSDLFVETESNLLSETYV